MVRRAVHFLSDVSRVRGMAHMFTVPLSAPASSLLSISRKRGLSGRKGSTHSCSTAGTARKENRWFHRDTCSQSINKRTSELQTGINSCVLLWLSTSYVCLLPYPSRVYNCVSLTNHSCVSKPVFSSLSLSARLFSSHLLLLLCLCAFLLSFVLNFPLPAFFLCVLLDSGLWVFRCLPHGVCIWVLTILTGLNRTDSRFQFR